MASTDKTEHHKSSQRGKSPVYHPWKTKWVLCNRETDNGCLNRISIPLSMWYNFSHIRLWNAYWCLYYRPSPSPINYVGNTPVPQVLQTWHLTRWLYHQENWWLQPCRRLRIESFSLRSYRENATAFPPKGNNYTSKGWTLMGRSLHT